MSASPFRTPQPPQRGRSEFHSSSKPPRHPTSDANDSARRSSARNLASSEMSPGVDGMLGKTMQSPSGWVAEGGRTPRSSGKKSVSDSDSPFREWATNSLGCLADVVSPERDEAGMLSASYSELSAVKLENSPMHHMASRDDDLKPAALEHSLTEDATVFPPSGLGQGTRSGGKRGAKKGGKGEGSALQSSGASRPRPEASPEAVDDPSSLQLMSQHLYTPQAPVHCVSRRPMTLTECHLFTFELYENKVIADGFEDEGPYHQRAQLHSRSRSRPIPMTPALTSETPDHDEEGGSDGRKRICSCKKSRCLKLYCECFAAGDLCGGCKCMDCANDGQHEQQRLQAVESIKQRNSNAFAPKIVDEEEQLDKPVGAHARGCRCKKSHCLKKYCECFQAQVKCTDKCKCEDCKNMAARPDETPRERADQSLSALLNLHSSGKGSSPDSMGRNTGRKGGHSMLSPPRNKKPRVLDFNVTATPSQSHGGLQVDLIQALVP